MNISNPARAHSGYMPTTGFLDAATRGMTFEILLNSSGTPEM
jgi:hypothetical protein